MTEDATLSEFLSADGTEPGDEDAGSDGGRTDHGREAEANDGPSADDADVEPAVATYAWGEYTCDRCGERTDRVWRDDGALVCPGCKPW